MDLTFKIIALSLLLLFIGPIWVLLSNQVDLKTDYTAASRKSANLAPDPKTTREAIIQVYAARAFNWRGLFATHCWIAVKPKDATTYTVYQVVGWRAYRGLSPLMVEEDIPDRYWFGNHPDVVKDIRGPRAEKLIGAIAQAARTYPYADVYRLWPGPNSNTFPAYVARKIPELELALPATAIGKDYLVNQHVIARSPSGTGYQISLAGIVGILIAKKEGLEINLFGEVFGIQFSPFGIKLPGIGLIPSSTPRQSSLL